MSLLWEMRRSVEELAGMEMEVLAAVLNFSPQFTPRTSGFERETVDVRKVIERVREEAATRIQSAWRGRAVRKRVRALRELAESYHKLRVLEPRPALQQGRNRGARALYARIRRADPDAGPHAWAARYYLARLGLQCLWRLKGAAYRSLAAWASAGGSGVGSRGSGAGTALANAGKC